MNLINKISRLYIINTVIVFAAGMFAIYWAVNLTISDQINTQLKDTIIETAGNLKEGKLYQNPPRLEIKETDKLLAPAGIFKDTAFFFAGENENVDYREYAETKTINGKIYLITARTSMVEKDDLFWAIFAVLSVAFALLLILLFMVNRRSSKKIFSPFHENLKKLEEFSLYENKSIELMPSSINEFEELNKALLFLSDRALTEYNSLKEFSEDLSHELQTPVAVIKSKLELLLQKENSDVETIGSVQSAYQNITRLDKLIRSLVLLTRLENKDFYKSEKILLADKLEKAAANFYEFAEMKNIKVLKSINASPALETNDNLLDIVISNLFSNAIKHNVDNGEIQIELNENFLTIKNTGMEPKQPTEKYFERFSYDNKTDTSLGLGLAITQKICTIYNWKIEYTYSEKIHTITINFK